MIYIMIKKFDEFEQLNESVRYHWLLQFFNGCEMINMKKLYFFIR